LGRDNHAAPVPLPAVWSGPPIETELILADPILVRRLTLVVELIAGCVDRVASTFLLVAVGADVARAIADR
jgi:hypothetical protein